MREIVIVISDLYLDPVQSSSVPALPGLEEVARFGRRSAIVGGWRAWLARQMGRNDLAPVAPASIVGVTSGETSPGTVWMATPVHFMAGLTSLHFDYRGLLRLPMEELTSLAEDFSTAFGDTGFHLKPLESGAFLLRSRNALSAVTTDPFRALAYGLEASLPNGPDAAALKRLGAEIEMWLHGHPINQIRASRGELPVSTLWLWGGGPALAPENPTSATPSTTAAPFGSDPYLAAVCRLNGVTLRPLPERLPGPTVCPDVRRGILVAEITPLLRLHPQWTLFEALAHIDALFVHPAIEQLRDGNLDSVLVVVNDFQLQVRRGDRLKFWRRRTKSGAHALRAFC